MGCLKCLVQKIMDLTPSLLPFNPLQVGFSYEPAILFEGRMLLLMKSIKLTSTQQCYIKQKASATPMGVALTFTFLI